VISRRRFLTSAAIALAPMGAPAHAQEYKAQQTKRTWRIGMFNAGARLPESVAGQDGFREELRSLGYVAGQNVVYEERWADADPAPAQLLVAPATSPRGRALDAGSRRA
jgi:hypothetical protein